MTNADNSLEKARQLLDLLRSEGFLVRLSPHHPGMIGIAPFSRLSTVYQRVIVQYKPQLLSLLREQAATALSQGCHCSIQAAAPFLAP